MLACALALVLMVDVSGSVSAPRYTLQHRGLAQALSDPSVRTELTRQLGGLAMTVIEWSDRRRTIVPWRVIHSDRDVDAIAEKLMGTERVMTGSTALGDALIEGIAAIERAPCDAQRKVIDISGDGRSNDGEFQPDEARRRAADKGITVNGLPIRGEEVGVVEYYRNNVITSDGFLVEAEGFEDFARAIRKKLVIEITMRLAPHAFWLE